MSAVYPVPLPHYELPSRYRWLGFVDCPHASYDLVTLVDNPTRLEVYCSDIVSRFMAAELVPWDRVFTFGVDKMEPALYARILDALAEHTSTPEAQAFYQRNTK